jgi:lysophospholipase L1-like esterase
LIDAPVFSYPSQLKFLLAGRYTAQQHQIEVFDEGVGGETTDVGIFRLPRALNADAADVLLVQEGVNDLHARGAAAIPVVVNNVRAMVREARSRGLVVFVGTLLPERPGGRSAGAPTLIAPTNDQLREMATAERAVLVDLYDAFGGVAGTLIGDDGLHPNEAGYRKIAETFFDAIQARLEVATP